MPERNAERKIHIRMGEDLHKRLRIRCAELDTTLQDYVVELLARELSTGKRPPRTAGSETGTRRER
jgi:plasmid stability protein